MSELTTARDHMREMARADHLPECSAPFTDRWGWTRTLRPDPDCAGCMPANDRVLWARLADEIDAYLGADDEPLWEEA